MRFSASIFALSLLATSALQAAEVVVSPGTNPELTVYNGDFGLVRESRMVRLPEGESRLAFTGVSRNLQAETAALQVGASDKVKPADVRIFDQTFAFNLMSPQSLLEQSIGKEVSVITTNAGNGRETVERAIVLSVQDGLILRIGDKIHTNHPGRIVFDSLPGDLRAVPTLLVTAAGPGGTDIPLEFSYLTGGLGWRADYVADYDSEGGRLTLTGWASITNTTGVEFKGAKLKLAAGQVNRTAPRPMPRPAMRMEAMTAAATMAQQDVSTESLDGLHLYTIARPVTLGTGESKQLSLIRAAAVPAKRDTVVQGQPWFYTSSMAGQRQEGFADTEVLVKNTKPPATKGKPEPEAVPGLGVALPAGIIRAYGQDSEGAPQFLGEDRIPHTAEGGDIRVKLGRDVEVPVVREQVQYVHAAETIHLTNWRITLRNTKARAVTVRVSEPIPGSWKIDKESLPSTKTDAGRAEWTVNLPAKGETVLEYSVRTTM